MIAIFIIWFIIRNRRRKRDESVLIIAEEFPACVNSRSRIEKVDNNEDAFNRLTEQNFDFVIIETAKLPGGNTKLSQCFIFDIPEENLDFAAKAVQTIEKHYTDSEFTVDSLSKILATSPSTLHRLFSQHFNDTPNNYIRTRRLQKAAQLLDAGDSHISHVCYSCGFNSPAYFSKRFREYYGLTPFEYIRRNSKKL